MDPADTQTPEPTKVPQPEAPRSEAPRSEVPQPEVPQPEVPQLEVPRVEVPRPQVAAARRVVIKLGTQVLLGEHHRLAEDRLRRLVGEVARCWHRGRQAMLVSSGALGLGWTSLGLEQAPEDAAQRRACAAVGQSLLVSFYEQAFAAHGRRCAQLLVTEEDFDHRGRYLDLRSTLEQLLRVGVVPILNENDAVLHGTMPKLAAGRAVFADNDRLAALVAAKCDAELLVLLTDVDGVFDHDPKHDRAAKVLPRIDDPRAVLGGLAAEPGSGTSRGGMRAKVEAARVAAFGGCQAIIASGCRQGALAAALAGRGEGTFFPAIASLPARRRWIAFAAATKGVLHLDEGAAEALRRRRASLLHVGVRAVEGDFARGEVVELRDAHGELIGRGLMAWNADETRRWVAEGEPPRGLDGRQATCLLRRTYVVMLDS